MDSEQRLSHRLIALGTVSNWNAPDPSTSLAHDAGAGAAGHRAPLLISAATKGERAEIWPRFSGAGRQKAASEYQRIADKRRPL